jgi:radical SAM superfamily enzyme YgiQ (UPF0313 family)
METDRLLLIYPKLGMSGSLVRHVPLSLLYAAIGSLQAGWAVDLVDVRLDPEHWREAIQAKMTSRTLLVGVSVLTGSPIVNALEMSRWVKQRWPGVKVVWGGPHATFNAAEILDEPSVDFVISGYGSQPLKELAGHLRGGADALPLDGIAGLSFRGPDGVVSVPPLPAFEVVDYRDIPYHLLESDLDNYGQLDSGQRIFPIYSAMGCPYNCAFCSSPAQYRPMKKKYVPLTAMEVVDHIQYVHDKYRADYIYFIDDDSFVQLDHVERIIDEINRRGIRIGLGFRGARVNEIMKMSDEFLTKLSQAGTDIMHIGAESGSPRILELINKNCSVEDIIAVNLKMARHPEIKTAYNWVVGLPGETMDDLRRTQKLMLKLIADNPSALIFIPNKFRPLPGTVLYELALQHGYRKPASLPEWANTEAEGDYRAPWYSDEQAAAINMMQVCSYFIDDKVFKVKVGNTWKFRLVKLAARLYGPVAKARLRLGFHGLLVEDLIFRWASAHYHD